jgi:hypothetical protein
MTRHMQDTTHPDVSPGFEDDDLQAHWRRVVGRRSFLRAWGWRVPRRCPAAPCSRARRWLPAALFPRVT